MAFILRSAKYTIVERTAGELAATWWEIGRSQGLKSKHKTARLYALKNFEKFIPKAIEHLLDILNDPTKPELMKDEIYSALMERANEPTLKQMIVEQPSYQVNGPNPFRKMN